MAQKVEEHSQGLVLGAWRAVTPFSHKCRFFLPSYVTWLIGPDVNARGQREREAAEFPFFPTLHLLVTISGFSVRWRCRLPHLLRDQTARLCAPAEWSVPPWSVLLRLRLTPSAWPLIPLGGTSFQQHLFKKEPPHLGQVTFRHRKPRKESALPGHLTQQLAWSAKPHKTDTSLVSYQS